MLLGPAAGGAGLQRGAVRDPVQVVAEQLRAADVPGPARQYEEGGLERVLRVVRTAGHPPARGQHHRPVPAHDLGERVLVARGHEPRQEVAVGHVGRAEDDPEQLPCERTGGLGRHLVFP